MPQNNLRITMSEFVTWQFAYYPLIWIFHSRRINYKINTFIKIIFYHFKDFFLKAHLSQLLAAEVYKMLNGNF